MTNSEVANDDPCGGDDPRTSRRGAGLWARLYLGSFGCAILIADEAERRGDEVGNFLMIGTPALPYPALLTGVLILLALVAAIDVLGRDSAHIRGLPQWVWFLVVVALPAIGPLAWSIIGRRRRRRRRPTASDRVVESFPEYDRKGRFVPTDPVADAAFLRQCRERAEQQRRSAELDRRRRDLGAD